MSNGVVALCCVLAKTTRLQWSPPGPPLEPLECICGFAVANGILIASCRPQSRPGCLTKPAQTTICVGLCDINCFVLSAHFRAVVA